MHVKILVTYYVQCSYSISVVIHDPCTRYTHMPHSHTCTHTYSHTYTHTHTSHTHTHTHTHTHFSLAHTHTHTHTLIYTGQPGWGIAWFINGTIIPELVVERGRTYTFLVYGGDNPADDSNYHPFYITGSINGGRLLNTAQERAVSAVN